MPIESSPNTLLWRFDDAATPDAWTSKQAKRIYDAAMEGEHDGTWREHAVSGSVKIATHKSRWPELFEPSYSYRYSDDVIAIGIKDHAAALRQQADRLENILRCYGPSAFRSQRIAVRAPVHPFFAEPAILSVIQRPDVDELWVHGRHFVRDESRAFVRKEEVTP